MEKIYANGNNPLTTEQKEEKVKKLTSIFENFLDELGFDRQNDTNLQDTPKRIAKMYVNELLSGNFNPPPDITFFPNTKNYDQIIVSGPIEVKSLCSHHFITFAGRCWVGVIPDKKVIGISKFSRIVEHFMRRPQIQEELTEQIVQYIEDLLQPKGIIVVMDCRHFCMYARGVEEPNATMKTSAVRGAFATNSSTRQEFFDLIKLGTQDLV
jgi:GTP cyclohydrolase I